MRKHVVSSVFLSSKRVFCLFYIDCNVENLIDLSFHIIEHIVIGDRENSLLAANFDNQIGCITIWNVAPTETIERDCLLRCGVLQRHLEPLAVFYCVLL